MISSLNGGHTKWWTLISSIPDVPTLELPVFWSIWCIGMVQCTILELLESQARSLLSCIRVELLWLKINHLKRAVLTVRPYLLIRPDLVITECLTVEPLKTTATEWLLKMKLNSTEQLFSLWLYSELDFPEGTFALIFGFNYPIDGRYNICLLGYLIPSNVDWLDFPRPCYFCCLTLNDKQTNSAFCFCWFVYVLNLSQTKSLNFALLYITWRAY